MLALTHHRGGAAVMVEALPAVTLAFLTRTQAAEGSVVVLGAGLLVTGEGERLALARES